MAATSATGVSGNGTVAGSQKGSDSMSLGVDKLIGPRIVAAGTETLSGTTAVIEFPGPTTSVTGYAIFLCNNSSTNPYVSTALATITDSSNWKFTVTAGSGDIVKWQCVKLGV